MSVRVIIQWAVAVAAVVVIFVCDRFKISERFRYNLRLVCCLIIMNVVTWEMQDRFGLSFWGGAAIAVAVICIIWALTKLPRKRA